ncbi:MAG: HigA family addiction module antitoxin [Acidimicrobiales bacterium]
MISVLTPAEVFPPGDYLRDELEERGWTAKEFAEILGRPAQVVSEILNGHKQIMPETALALAEALGTSAELWTNLQTKFNLHEAKSLRPLVTDVTRRSLLRSRVPVAELRQRGWLPDSDDLDVLEAAVKELLGISNLSEEPHFAVAARRTNATASFSAQQTAWLARLRRVAQVGNVTNFDAQKARTLAEDLVHRIHDPTDLGQLEQWLAEVGVVLVTLLPLKSSKLDGAAMILDNGIPVIGLTSRGDRMDSYVFTLLHELAHICLGHIETGAVRTDEDIVSATGLDDIEEAANRQAANWILSEEIAMPDGRPSLGTILQLAQRHRIHPSFVIGRMQRERQDWGLLRGSIPRVRSHVTPER